MRKTPPFVRLLHRLATPAVSLPPRVATRGERIERGIGSLLVAGGLLAMALLTLRPGYQSESLPFWCLACGDQRLVDVALNLLLFVPLGAGLGLRRVPLVRATIVAMSCTLAIEFLQFSVVSGRDASARDILANVIGAVAGWMAGHEWRTLVLPRPRVARRVAIVGSVAWLGSQAFTAWAMQVALPEPPWWARLKPPYHGEARFKASFTGKLDAVAVGAVDVPYSDQLEQGDEARRSLLAGEPLRVVVSATPPTPGLAPIVVVTAGPVFDVVSLIQDGRDLVFEATIRATRIGLRTPAVRLADAIPRGGATPTTLEGSYVDGRYRLRAVHDGAVRERLLAASASMAWAFLVRSPGYAFGPEFHLMTALWLAVWWLVLGYWYALAVRGPLRLVERGPMLAALGTTALFGLAAIPVLNGLPVAHWTEWLGMVAGMAGGWGLARLAPRSLRMPAQRVVWVPPERVGRALRRR